MAPHKPIYAIVLDAGPILRNEASGSTLLAKAERLYTVTPVISEIRDPSARSRVETTLLPFLTIRNPKPDSVKFIRDFSRKTGDLHVLSSADIQVLALSYELEVELNGGDWRLRKAPGQKKLNGLPPIIQPVIAESPALVSQAEQAGNVSSSIEDSVPNVSPPPKREDTEYQVSDQDNTTACEGSKISQILESVHIRNQEPNQGGVTDPLNSDPTADTNSEQDARLSESDTSGSEGWITPSNITKQRAKDENASLEHLSNDKVLQVGTLTGDFAMQNVLLQIGLDLLSPSMQRIKNIRTYVLRCHACFEKIKDMSKQFCPKCGNSTLTRVSCSTNAKGEFKIHLKKNMQWNHRGDRYSIPKPVSGTANGKVGQSKGGGKGGWGQDLILSEDQKEYQRALTGRSRRKETDLMDEDYLPGILTGERGKAGGRPKVGAGRNVNSKKRI